MKVSGLTAISMYVAGILAVSTVSGAAPAGPTATQRRVSVQDFGAIGDGIADDTAAIQAALDAAKGEDRTAAGRTVFSLYFPNVPGGFYKITDSLLVDGTHGLVIYGDGALTQRGMQQAAIRWYGDESKPIFWVKGGTGTPSNPNFYITFRDLTLSGYPETLPRQGALPANLALTGIHFGNLKGKPDNTLLRRAIVENVHITNCRFGIWSGNPDGLNTDHATIQITGCVLTGNAQAGILWGTGNALVNVISCDINNNGWAGKAFGFDAYSAPVGANIHVTSGYVDIVSLTSAGGGSNKPTTADIYQGNGRVSVINAWSDTHGYFLYQASASPSGRQLTRHPAQITGVRHYEGTMNEENTPHSLRIVAPGTLISSCLLYGNIEVAADDVKNEYGLGARPVFAGINFIRKNATYIGSGVNNQRSLTVLGNAGNSAQILLGGADKGVPLTHKGSKVPQILSMGDNPTLFQALNAASGGTAVSFHAETADADKAHILLMNGFFLPTGILPMQSHKMVWLLELGGSQGWRIKGLDRSGFSSEVPLNLFVDFGGLKVAPVSGSRHEAAFQPPLRNGPPTVAEGDYWQGSIYFDTGTKKLRVNTGGDTWEDLH